MVRRKAIIRHKWIPFGMLYTLFIGLGVASASQSAPQGPCAQIIAACQDAGFVQGGAKTGNGLQVDCIEPIMQGKAAEYQASKPLPGVDPQLVAACKAKNPKFGQPAASPSKSSSESLSESPSTSPSQAPSQAPSQMNGQPPPAAPVPDIPAPARPSSSGRPNIVFILTDDLALNLVQYMPHVIKMQKDGVTFANYFVTDSLCCPSRSSIFTGRYPHDTGVFKNTGIDGGYQVFHARGNDQTTFATALSAAGYRTAFMGKYLNGYEPRQDPIPPGWAHWVVAGNGYAEFRYVFNQDGQLVRHGMKPDDYLTDVVAALGVQFVKQKTGAPFFIEIATFAPHTPYTPAPRDANAFPGLRAPRTPAYDAPHDANAPRWLQAHPALTEADMAMIDRDFRKRAQSVLAVDKMIGELQAAIAAIGQEKNTYFIFSSDNGYHMGEFRLMPGKMTAYDTDIHVPLIVTGPGVPAGVTVQEVVENIDLCPTFTDLAGAAAPASVDGISLVPFLRAQNVEAWRTFTLVEHHGPVRDVVDPDMPSVRSGNPTTYEAIRSRTALYVEYADGEKEYHDLATDPNELRNTFASLSAEQKAYLHATVVAMANCHDAKACWAAQRAASITPRK
jgi:N-acetylglucosamine-6-sulfatase